jgi:ABC-type glutathione transport system ATPase component
MPDKKPVLEVRNLSVALPTGADRAHAVEKVSFTVNPGEIVCLVGESGSGKSVIAFTVMGLLAKNLAQLYRTQATMRRMGWTLGASSQSGFGMRA